VADQKSLGEKKRAFGTYQTRVEESIDLTPRNRGIRFRLPEGKTMDFKAGQFVQVFVPQEGKPRRTSYSIASPPKHKGFFDLCVTLVDGGKSSSYIHSVKAGDNVKVMGPLGKFTISDSPRDIVFICTGSGIAPFRSMINDLVDKNTKKTIYLIYGNRYDTDIIYKEEWDKLAKDHSNFKVLYTLSRPEKWTGHKGYVQEKIKDFVPDPGSMDYYICGLTNMINAVQERLISLGVPKEQIHFERYD